jgi:hypothetical protein
MHSGNIPIYSKASKSLTSKEILQLCFSEVKDESMWIHDDIFFDAVSVDILHYTISTLLGF